MEQLQSRLLKATEKKQTAQSVDDRLSAAQLLDDAKADLKKVQYSLFLCCCSCVVYMVNSFDLLSFVESNTNSNPKRLHIALTTMSFFTPLWNLQDQKRRFEEKHQYKTTPTLASIEGRIAKWAEDLRKLEVDIRNRDENKEVALGTSKINYMDPRISVAWCKRCEVPIDKVFAKTLRDKFNWAMAVPPDWQFE